MITAFSHIGFLEISSSLHSTNKGCSTVNVARTRKLQGGPTQGRGIGTGWPGTRPGPQRISIVGAQGMRITDPDSV
jgi:hypothetical protein